MVSMLNGISLALKNVRRFRRLERSQVQKNMQKIDCWKTTNDSHPSSIGETL